jgi:hypothetical protein
MGFCIPLDFASATRHVPEKKMRGSVRAGRLKVLGSRKLRQTLDSSKIKQADPPLPQFLLGLQVDFL